MIIYSDDVKLRAQMSKIQSQQSDHTAVFSCTDCFFARPITPQRSQAYRQSCAYVVEGGLWIEQRVSFPFVGGQSK